MKTDNVKPLETRLSSSKFYRIIPHDNAMVPIKGIFSNEWVTLFICMKIKPFGNNNYIL